MKLISGAGNLGINEDSCEDRFGRIFNILAIRFYAAVSILFILIYF
jgi:hypothetical protein